MTPTCPGILSLRETERALSLRLIYLAEPVIAVLVLLVLAPILVLIAVVITVLARCSPLVRHTRVGLRGSRLPMLKFRTMWEARHRWAPPFVIEEVAAPVPTAKNGGDHRITSRFAAWCRRYSLDELPQLYHIARGEMSFVGPRPITRAELDTYYGVRAEEVLSVRPGLTGLWQMKGRSHLSYSQRRRLDLFFVRSASPGLYLKILIGSIPKVLRGHGAC